MWLFDMFKRKDAHKDTHREALVEYERYLGERAHWDQVVNDQEKVVLKQREQILRRDR